MEAAVKAEEVAGIRYGPAEQERHKVTVLERAIVEVRDGWDQPPYTHRAFECIPPCYYCEGRTEDPDRLCPACQQFMRTVVNGETFDEQFSELNRYKQTITPWMLGLHLVRDEKGLIVGTRTPQVCEHLIRDEQGFVVARWEPETCL
jgi:hypothetical protein